MKTALSIVAGCLLIAGSAQARAVGFQTISVPVPRDAPMAGAVWYPAKGKEALVHLGPYLQSVATDAPIAGRNHPVVVISHGTGGTLFDHYDTGVALARAGFVVAAISHTGDTVGDASRVLRVTERPGQLSRLIDYVTTGWSGRGAIDARRIGAFGHSSGGFTVLSAVGGEPDFARTFGPHCAEHPEFYDCSFARTPGATPVKLTPVAHDNRIRAAVVAAPGLAFAFEPDGLRKVSVPVQIWRAEQDAIVPHPYYAEAIRRQLPDADYRVVAGAGHFDFMAPCSAALAKAAPLVCVKTIDRKAFHRDFNVEVVRFFRRRLR